MRPVTVKFSFGVLVWSWSLVFAAGCQQPRTTEREHKEMKAIRAAEVRGEAMHCVQCLSEAVYRAQPFCKRLDDAREHAAWVFEEGPLSMNLQYRTWWFECKRVVPELIEPAKAFGRALRDQVIDLDADATLTKAEAAEIRRLVARGLELADEIAEAVHARNIILLSRLEPALRRYPLPSAERRLGLPPPPPRETARDR
jgi:hypothetical protein